MIEWKRVDEPGQSPEESRRSGTFRLYGSVNGSLIAEVHCGCADLRRHYAPADMPRVNSAIHICDLTEFIAALLALETIRRETFE
jgi:hypothetical protein